MARGRRPQGNYKGKASVLSTRITTELREAIETAAAAKQHSLSQEIEYRLRRSFDEDRALLEKLGGPRNYAVLRMISGLMGTFADPYAPEATWLDDPRLYDRLVRMVDTVFAELRPPADSRAAEIDRAGADVQAAQRVASLLLAVRDAPPALSIDPSNPAAFIRSDLGPVADRIGRQKGRRTVAGTAEDFARAAEELKREENEGSRK